VAGAEPVFSRKRKRGLSTRVHDHHHKKRRGAEEDAETESIKKHGHHRRKRKGVFPEEVEEAGDADQAAEVDESIPAWYLEMPQQGTPLAWEEGPDEQQRTPAQPFLTPVALPPNLLVIESSSSETL
jgi:hypothetical protein